MKNENRGASVADGSSVTDDPGRTSRRYRIALVSDFFYPRLGGVENHIWSLAQELLKLGHKVILITHAYKGKKGVHRLSMDGNKYYLKVYYCPIVPMVDEDSLPTFTATFPLFRWIFIREQIELVHAHQATSTLANESVVYAGVLGLTAVYTDHSLFNLHDLAGIILNRVLTTTLATVDAVICVSKACRDNFILRAQSLDTKRVFVVPNAVVAANFQPPTNSANPGGQQTRSKNDDRVIVIVVSRLVFRKGMDLLLVIIPIICKANGKVDFLIAGDGPKGLDLKEMVAKEGLQDRVEFLGGVPHAQVRNVLIRGDIFLNCSLTESFCIANLEASCAGLTVVSTNVGGIPEVLDEAVYLADPSVPQMAKALQQAISDHQRNGPVDPWPRHERLRKRYAWSRVAEQTVQVYDYACGQPRKTFLERLHCYQNVGGGGITGLVVAWLAVTLELFARIVFWLQALERIDVLPATIDDDEEDYETKESKS